MKKILALAEVLDNLSRMPRTGGVLFAGMNLAYGDSLMDHSYKVAYLTLLFAKVAQKNDIGTNTEKLLISAITHDWCEAILLDVPSGSPSYKSYFKDIDIKSEMKKAEANANQAISDFLQEDIDLGVNIELSDKENAILATADLVALLMEVLEWKYQHLNYEWIDYLWSNTLKRVESVISDNLPFMQELIVELQTRYANGMKAANPFLTKPEFQTLRASAQ